MALVTISLRFSGVDCSTVLAKSNMLICQNDGSVSNVGDTKELLKSHKCKKKLIVTLAVESEQVRKLARKKLMTTNGCRLSRVL